MIVEKKYIPKSMYSIKCPYTMQPTYITIHNTANDASADNEYNYMTKVNGKSTTGFHIVVDDKKAIYAIPLERNSWNAGDGINGPGNRKSISIEICYSKSGGERYRKAEENCIQLVVTLFKQYGMDISKLRKHQDWSGKYCPHRILSENRWESFKKRVSDKLNNNSKFNVGDKIKINTINNYKYYIADDVKYLYGVYQIRENINAGGVSNFSWIDNGIPEKCVDLVDANGIKLKDSDRRHVKKGNKFVFAKIFTIKKIVRDKNRIYLYLDFDNNEMHRFWVIEDNCVNA